MTSTLRKIEPGQNSALHALLAELAMMDYKAELIQRFTNDRTASSRDLTFNEAGEILEHLRAERNSRTKGMRGKVVHYLCLLGMVKGDGAPDYDRINGFIRGIGKNNPGKRSLINLRIDECRLVLNQVEVMYKNTVRKKMGK